MFVAYVGMRPPRQKKVTFLKRVARRRKRSSTHRRAQSSGSSNFGSESGGMDDSLGHINGDTSIGMIE
jgi:hypothetical protein